MRSLSKSRGIDSPLVFKSKRRVETGLRIFNSPDYIRNETHKRDFESRSLAKNRDFRTESSVVRISSADPCCLELQLFASWNGERVSSLFKLQFQQLLMWNSSTCRIKTDSKWSSGTSFARGCTRWAVGCPERVPRLIYWPFTSRFPHSMLNVKRFIQDLLIKKTNLNFFLWKSFVFLFHNTPIMNYSSRDKNLRFIIMD